MPIWRTRDAELTPERRAPGGGTPSRGYLAGSCTLRALLSPLGFLPSARRTSVGERSNVRALGLPEPGGTAPRARELRFTAVSPSAELATASPPGRDPAWKADFSTPTETSPPPTAFSHLYHPSQSALELHLFSITSPLPGTGQKRGDAWGKPSELSPRWPRRPFTRPDGRPALPHAPLGLSLSSPARGPPVPRTWASSRSTFSCIIALSRSREKPGSGGSGAAAEPPRAPSMAASRAWRSLVRTPRYTQEAAASAESRTGSAEQHGPARRGQRSPPQPSRPAAPRLLPSMLLHPSAAAAFISFPPPPMEATNLQTKIIARN